MTTSARISRRKMIGQSLGASLAVPLLVSCQKKTAPQSSAQPVGEKPIPPSEQVTIGIIGCGRRNYQLQEGRGGQGKPPAYSRIVAVSDLNLTRAEQWGETWGADPYQDYRKMLDRDDIDVIIYATPEHWHYLPCIHSVQAGKDVYGEQPLGHTIAEGRAMVQAVRNHNRIFQTGEQQRSHPETRRGVEMIRNGVIGKIQRIIGYNYPSPFEADFPGQPTPQGLDWDRWCGPNEVVPYNVNIYLSRIPYERTKYFPNAEEEAAVGPGWMSFRPYSGGELVNWGCHGLSMVQWALDLDDGGPSEVWVEPAEKLEAVTYTEPETRDRGDDSADNSIIHYRFPGDVVLELSSDDKNLGGGAKFVGEKGSITVIRDQCICDPPELADEPLPADAERVYASDNHMENFFECVKTRKDPIMDVENGHRVATLCHLGNIARWEGRKLTWDPVKEEFPGDKAANQYLDTPKRSGFEIPKDL